MNKELEALNDIFAELDSLGMTPTIPIDDGNYDKNVVEYVRKEYEIVKQALTPPSEEEVCKALSEHFAKNPQFNNVVNIRFNKDAGIILIVWKSGGFSHVLDYSHDMKDAPHLITMIGKFYEGEMNNE